MAHSERGLPHSFVAFMAFFRLRLACFAASWLALACLMSAPAVAQNAPQPIPALTASVIDQTRSLTEAQKQRITQNLNRLEDQYGAQIVVLMVATTKPEALEAYANRVAQNWKIGRAKEGDGLLFVIAKNDRTMRFEVARGLEGVIPDIAAARIIDHVVSPLFREGDFAGGIEAGIDALRTRIATNGEASAVQPSPASHREAQEQAAPVHAPTTLANEAGSGRSVAGRVVETPYTPPAVEPQSWFSSLFDSSFGSAFVLFAIAGVFAGFYYGLQLLRRTIGTFPALLVAGGITGGGTYWAFASGLAALIVAAIVCLMVLGIISPKTLAAIAASSSSSSSRSGGGSSSSGRSRSGGGGSFGGGGASGRW